MYICMYLLKYMCIYMYEAKKVYICMYVCIYICILERERCIYTYICMYVYRYINISIFRIFIFLLAIGPLSSCQENQVARNDRPLYPQVAHN